MIEYRSQYDVLAIWRLLLAGSKVVKILAFFLYRNIPSITHAN